MVPVAGSAYTYAYATLGELFAWIIGWDLVLEYAVGPSTVAHGWSRALPRISYRLLGIPCAESMFATAPFDYISPQYRNSLSTDRVVFRSARDSDHVRHYRNSGQRHPGERQTSMR